MLQSYTVLVVLIIFPLFADARLHERMMAAIVISDSDSEFERDVQEATRWLLMTVAPSPVREVVSDSEDDEEKGSQEIALVSEPSCGSWRATRLSL